MLKKPDIPNKHLISYFVLFDEAASKILLVDHKNAQLWLPPGGHVEVNESPKAAAKRECFEELGIEADFWCETPIFVTSIMTTGRVAGHTDVCLWYVLKGSHRDRYHFDQDEFHEVRWFGDNELPWSLSDPHLQRFMKKLQKITAQNRED
ncbi:NUDIX hydrolase [Piscirickettsia litoralis]|uniref:NUDIX hydrolase n=1 Tax=Piscirickettsia litoralis TaxID=1891921 RepID=UPI00191296F4|nr:NUDIX hydrolase [Piscirickettsia litoralis]